MDGDSQAGVGRVYKSPRHVQIFVLNRSRKTWKNKYTQLKENQKRLENRVRDVMKSREKWASESRDLTARLKELSAENAALQRELEIEKKASCFVV